MVSQITGLTIVYSTVYLDADRRKHQSSASLAFMRGVPRWPVNSPLKRTVTGKMFPCDDVLVYLNPGTENELHILSTVVFMITLTVGISPDTFWFLIISALWSGQHGRNFADDIVRCIFFSENAWFQFKISFRFVCKVPVCNIPSLIRIVAARRSYDKP